MGVWLQSWPSSLVDEMHQQGLWPSVATTALWVLQPGLQPVVILMILMSVYVDDDKSGLTALR